MAHLVVVSYRLGGNDGVSIEAAKWIDAFAELGHHVRTVAGDGDADVLLHELAIGSSTAPSFAALTRVLSNADVVVVENLVSLPLNVAARDVLYDVLEGRPALFRHHDLPWQRDEWVESDTPHDDASWRHVTINDRSRRELRARGLDAVTIRNSFDCDPPVGRRGSTRTSLGLSDETVVLVPTRAIPRKNVAGALQLASSLHAVLWLLGPAEDGFGPTLTTLLDDASVRVLRGLPSGFDVHDAYAACDLVVMPSTWEGFGNPVLESVTHRRPLAVYPYPVLAEIESFGFRFFGLDDVSGITSFVENPDEALLGHNLVIARSHFNIVGLPARLATLLGALGAN